MHSIRVKAEYREGLAMDVIVIIIIGVIFAAIGQVSWKLGMNQVGQ